MLAQIHTFITTHHLIPENSTVVVGLSGGPDSVFLLHLLADMHQQKNISLIAAHLDHQWRAESHHDVLFCKQITQELGIPFEHGTAAEFAHLIKHNGSQEEVGRKLRRIFLENVAHKHNAHAIALAHHLDDQEETFFIRLIRGTTLSGLIGMKPRNGKYIRPLLETRKEAILTYLREQNIAYLTDPTNSAETYLRNRIRLKIVPLLHEADARFDGNFLRTLHSLQASESYLDHLTKKIFSQITYMKDGSARLDTTQFFAQDPYMQKRLLMHWLILHQAPFVPTKRFLDEITRFFEQSGSKEHAIHEQWSVVKDNNLAWIKKADVVNTPAV